jgi:glycosyl hydrolase family 43
MKPSMGRTNHLLVQPLSLQTAEVSPGRPLADRTVLEMLVEGLPSLFLEAHVIRHEAFSCTVRRMKSTVRFGIIALLTALAFCLAPSGQAVRAQGTQRLDTSGNQVDAHDGQLLFWNNQYVWIGTAYGKQGSSCYFELNSPTSQFCGFKAYTSGSAAGPWTDHGTLFDPAPWQGRCAAPNFGCFRPHEVYNPATDRWVLWANVSDRNTLPSDPQVQAWTSASPLGPFIAAGEPILHGNFSGEIIGDLSLFVDDNGQGYAAYTSVCPAGVCQASQILAIMVERLNGTFTDGAGDKLQSIGLPSYQAPPGSGLNEAPSMFKRNGTYYLTFSDPACPYCSGTGTTYDTASNPDGTWTNRGSISTDSCGGQPASVNQTPGGFIYQSDLWLGTNNETAANQHWEKLDFNSDGTIKPLTCTEWTG